MCAPHWFIDAPRRRGIARTLASGALLFALAACGDATGPGATTPGIRVVAAPPTTGDALSTPVQALVVEVIGPGDSPVAGTPVRFSTGRMPDSAGVMVNAMQVGLLTGTYLQSEAVATTDAQGRAAARVGFGPVPGSGSIIVEALAYGYRDSARFTIRTGPAAQLELSVGDTAAFVGAHFGLGVRVADAAGNPRSDAVAFEAHGSAATVDGAGTVAARDFGRATIVARVGALADSIAVVVVPTGALALRGGPAAGITLMNLDGSGTVRFTPATPTSMPADVDGLEWLPGTSDLVVLQSPWDAPPRLLRATTGGSVQPYIPTPSVGHMESFALAANGTAIFLGATTCNVASILYRVTLPDLTLTRLSPPGDDCFETADDDPSPSPDASQLVYAKREVGHASHLRRMDVATHVITDLGRSGSAARWSPQGDLIAYDDDGVIKVVTPDGATARTVSPPGPHFDPGVDWTPDGQWLIMHGLDDPYAGSTGHLWLVRLSDLLTLKLPFGALTAYPVYRRQPLGAGGS